MTRIIDLNTPKIIDLKDNTLTDCVECYQCRAFILEAISGTEELPWVNPCDCLGDKKVYSKKRSRYCPVPVCADCWAAIRISWDFKPPTPEICSICGWLELGCNLTPDMCDDHEGSKQYTAGA
ncbi:MAG: hypothetical protein ACXV7G_12690 [Halobacteriota archaeon]